MNRHLFVLRVIVKDGERALLTRDGRFERALEPGRHILFDPSRKLAVELFNVVRAEFSAERYAVLKAAFLPLPLRDRQRRRGQIHAHDFPADGGEAQRHVPWPRGHL